MRKGVSVSPCVVGIPQRMNPPPPGKRALARLTSAQRQVRRDAVAVEWGKTASAARRLPAALPAPARGRRLAAAVGSGPNLRRPARIEDPGQLRSGSSPRSGAVEPPGASDDQGQGKGACLLKGARNEVVESGGHVDGHGGPPEMRKARLGVRAGFARASEDRRRAAPYPNRKGQRRARGPRRRGSDARARPAECELRRFSFQGM